MRDLVLFTDFQNSCSQPMQNPAQICSGRHVEDTSRKVWKHTFCQEFLSGLAFRGLGGHGHFYAILISVKYLDFFCTEWEYMAKKHKIPNFKVDLTDNLLTTKPPEVCADVHLHLPSCSLEHVLDLCSFSVNTVEIWNLGLLIQFVQNGEMFCHFWQNVTKFRVCLL